MYDFNRSSYVNFYVIPLMFPTKSGTAVHIAVLKNYSPV